MSKKKLRLLLTKKCNRSCAGCCNKGWSLKNLPACINFSGYREILLTGGEPLLKPELVKTTISSIRDENLFCLIYLYTAKVDEIDKVLEILELLDGMCVTLHEQEDVQKFAKFTNSISERIMITKSLRLNVFKGIDISEANTFGWMVKSDIEWIENCPLPENEVFMRL